MGTQYRVSCNRCGYGDNVKVGGSRATYKTDSPFPVLCHDCKKIGSTNTKSGGPPACNRCGGNNVTVYGKETLGGLSRWVFALHGDEDFNSSVLTPGTHRCPQCDGIGLTFEAGRLFD